jgi:hypothetical protein
VTQPQPPRRDLLSVVENPRLALSASLVLCAPAIVGVNLRIYWSPPIAVAILILAVIVGQYMRQHYLEKPRKIWRGSPRVTFVINVLTILGCGVGIYYAVAPWEPEFEVTNALHLQLGCIVAAMAFFVVMAPIWWLLALRNEGPYKRSRKLLRFVGENALNLVIAAPLVGYFGTIPFGFIYIEEVATAAPDFLDRQGFLLLLTLLYFGPIALIWGYVDLKKQLAKLR